MASARRIGLSTAVKIARRIDRGISQWSRGETGSARRIAAVMQWSINKNRYLSSAVMQWRGVPEWPSIQFRRFENRFIRHPPSELGYTVDVADLLFTPERDFLVKNNGQKIKVDELRGKTIVLCMVPLDVMALRPLGGKDTCDMIDAYCELQRIGSDVEFVFVPLLLRGAGSLNERYLSEEAYFHHLFSTIPFPAIPFSDAQSRDSPLVQTFSVDALLCEYLPYWVVIDPTNTVVAHRFYHPALFKLFGGAELHPLSKERIWEVDASHGSQSTAQCISQWDKLLTSDTRDFLLSSNGDKVPISSLKGKLVGLYFCENIPHPPRMQAIKKVYEEAKSRGYDFEIVQITFHYHPFNAIRLDTDPTVQQCCEDVNWLKLPFKDPSCRKVQRILKCREENQEEEEVNEEEERLIRRFEEGEEDEEYEKHWVGDCLVDKQWVGDSLVLIYPCQGEAEAEAEADHSSGVLFELSGAKILQRWGIEGYPFTQLDLYKAEYELQKREVTLQSLFPPGEHLLRSVGDGFDLVDPVSQLYGKRVLVLFAPHSLSHSVFGDNFVSMLKSKYDAQSKDNVAKGNKFEVVYVSTSFDKSSFDEFTKGMPWLVRPFTSESGWSLLCKVFKSYVRGPRAAAFNEQGELIAKADNLHKKKEGDKLQFPFIDQDLEKRIRLEVEEMCDAANYRRSA